MEDLTTYCENTWCPGCGNFGIFNSFKKAVIKLEERGTPREKIVITAGIGCHAKIFDYLKFSGLYSLHGRSMSSAQGMKLANPDLKLVVFTGDGDAMGEGLAHVLFAAKRNADITIVMHNNRVYGLTTGQFTPTSEKGYKGPSTPGGSIEEPMNPLAMVLTAGATFVARTYSGKISQMIDVLVEAIEHEGFSFIEVLQPCVSFNNLFKTFNDLVEEFDAPAENIEDALKMAWQTDRLPIGVLYKRTDNLPFHKELYGDKVPVKDRMARKERLENIKALLSK